MPVWNHNINYHDLLLRAVPSPCNDALDVGCGDGMFARRLAEKAGSVVGVDLSEEMISKAGSDGASVPTLRFVQGDFLQLPLPVGGFDFVSALATVHHMDLRLAVEKMRLLLRPGGVLVILGLARDGSPRDLMTSVFAVPVNRVLRLRRGWYDPDFRVRSPTMTYQEVRSVTASILPGSSFRRLLLFRYLLLWRKD